MYQYRSYQRIGLVRTYWSMTPPNGIYRCEIAVNSDEPSVTQSLYVGLYFNDRGNFLLIDLILVCIYSYSAPLLGVFVSYRRYNDFW